MGNCCQKKKKEDEKDLGEHFISHKEQSKIEPQLKKPHSVKINLDPDHPNNFVSQPKPKQEKISPEDFEIIRVLGKGAFGTVYLVKKKGVKQLMAMKSLAKKELVKKNQVFNTKTEKNILQINGSNFIVKLFYAFQTDDKFYMVLEYMEGGELFFHLKKHKRFSEERVKFYAAEVILAIEYLHTYGIIYRDLKPENVLMDKEGHIKLTDFGLSKKAVSTNTFCGTPEYLAPEVLTGENHDKSVDWWSLGVLIYEMLAGVPPFFSKDTMEMYQKILHEDPRMKSWFSEEVGDIIFGLLTKEKNERLGAGPKDAEDIKNHRWFKEVDWEKMELCMVPPPYRPGKDDTDTFKYFDPKIQQKWDNVHPPQAPTEEVFCDMETRVLMENSSRDSDALEMEGFTYEKEETPLQKMLRNDSSSYRSASPQ